MHAHDRSRSLRYSVHAPSVFWVDLPKLDLKPGAPVLQLDLHATPIRAGEVSKEFKPAAPFKWMAPHG